MALSEREILERLRDAVIALKDVRAQRDNLLQQKSEPIAIVGMACRFPGDANTPETYFDLLLNGVDTITAVPANRWPIDSRIDADPRLQGARWGAFVNNIDMFDASFFGISPREAERMDPQQRFLLEIAWEALERSGIVPSSLVGSKTGVFVGVLNTDYYFMNLSLPWEQHDAYSATGNGHCFPAGRLAYALGLQGPAMSIDTACSSSLVAIHLGCQSLRSRECDMALVGGVNHMLHPLMAELIAKTGALAPDGRCKSFDTLANGYVRGEGCGVVILKRLSDAQRSGDPIIAVIRGSAVNQDGRSTGLTTPNVLAQEAMLAQALGSAQINAEDIGYIEAHGTGTPLGDPIEMDALCAAYGKKRTNGARCWIGTVKTNIGHLEAAAGVAGLMKAALALQREKIPTNLHFNSLNPRISLQGTDMAIATDMVPWPRSDKPRRAGVSAFGMSGTNAHVILEEAPQSVAKTPPAKERSAYLLPISAKTPEALSVLVKSFADWFASTTNVALVDMIHTASMRREHHDYRVAAIAGNREEFSRLLSSFAGNQPPQGILQGHAKEQGNPKVVFIFPGQGSQWIGMGRELLVEEPVFREAIEACDRAVQTEAGFSVLEQLGADEAKSRLSEIDVVQPLLFAFEVALAALWQSWGITPDYVVGHSMGEVAAAHVAGMLTLEDAVKIICQRSRLMRRLSGQGAMALVELPMAEAEAAVARYSETLSAAVSNGPRTTVLSGDPATLDKVITELEHRGVFCRRVKVDVASHSPQVDVLHNELLDALRDLRPMSGKLRMVSTVTGKPLHGDHLSAHYWWNNLRQPVRFSHVTHELMQEHFSIFLELSPHPILLSAVEESLQDAPRGGMAVASLVRQTPQRRMLLESLGKMWTRGLRFDWSTVEPGGHHVVTMPTYPWQRKRYWIETTEVRPQITPPQVSLDDWLFTLEWQLSPIKEPTITFARTQGVWLIIMDSGRIGKNLMVRLRSCGATCIRVDIGSDYLKHSPHHYSIDIANRTSYAKLLDEVLALEGGCCGIVHLANLDAPSWDNTTVDTLNSWQHQGLMSALYLTQALVRQHQQQVPKLWLVSQGAIATQPSDVIRSIAQAPLWGLARTIMLEHPELHCACIDLDSALKFDAITTLVQQLEAEDSEEHIAFRANGRFVARLVRTRMEVAPRLDFQLAANASYLITGGLGGLGLSVAQWLLNAGAKHIALMGRNAPTAEAREAIHLMERGGAKVRILQCDVAQPNDVLNALCVFGDEMPELRGIVHAAGVLDDHTLLELSEQNIRTVFAPKVLGAWNLHTFTSTQKLDFFVLYSSGASLLGSSGQANYAAANAFLDALAHARQARGLPAMSIQWGAFAEVGLAAKQVNRGSRLQRYGLAAFLPADGTHVLHQLLQRPRAEIGVLRLNVSQWLENFPELTKRPLWSNLITSLNAAKREKSAPTTIVEKPPQEPDFATQWAHASPSARAKLLEEHVRAQFGRVLRMDPSAIDIHEKINHYGVDSLMAIELRNRLQGALKIQFSVTEIWTHGSVSELAAWLGDKITSKSGDSAVDTTSSPAVHLRSSLTKTDGAPGQWVVIPRSSPNAKMRLFCFPYAGGGATVYSSWPEKLTADIEICAIEPPGRHARINEPLPRSVEEMVAAIIPAIMPYLDRPFAMFGHCLGAIVMFEVARKLIADHKKAPLQLFASAAPGPRQYLVPNVAARSDSEFLELLRAIGIAQKEVLDDPDIVRAMLPMVRSDFELAAKYECKVQAQIDVPITTFAADGDVFAPPNAVQSWRNETNGYFSTHTFRGGHYFLVPERDQIINVVTTETRHRYATVQQTIAKHESIRRLGNVGSRDETFLRLVCFPGFGGVAADFDHLSTALPRGIEVYAVELPGHGTRIDEAPLGHVNDIVGHIMNTMHDGDHPLVFLGNNLGALVMYDLVIRRQLLGQTLPVGLVVIGAMAPHLHYFAPLHEQSDEAFRAALELFRLNLGTDGSQVSRALHADAAALAQYRWTPTTTLDIPICAIGGSDDTFVSPAGVAAWREMTRQQFVFQQLPGNSPILRRNHGISKLIGEEIAKWVNARKL